LDTEKDDQKPKLGRNVWVFMNFPQQLASKYVPQLVPAFRPFYQPRSHGYLCLLNKFPTANELNNSHCL